MLDSLRNASYNPRVTQMKAKINEVPFISMLFVTGIWQRIVGNSVVNFDEQRDVAYVQEEVHPRAPVLTELAQDDVFVCLASQWSGQTLPSLII